LEWGLPASTQTIRNTIPNATKKEMKKLIGIPPLRFQEFQWVVNCVKRETELQSGTSVEVCILENAAKVIEYIHCR
jgi:hypothetical protein